MPTGTTREPTAHTFASPPLEEASVVDVMRVGIVSCSPDTPLRSIARIMATYRIHSVVVSEMEGATPIGVVSDIDIAVAAASGSGKTTARQLARSEPVTVAANDSLERATQLKAEHEVSHLVVIQPHSGQPVGVLSTLDLAAVLAGGGMGLAAGPR